MTASFVESLDVRPETAGVIASGAESTPVTPAGRMPGIPAAGGYCPYDAGRERPAARNPRVLTGPVAAAGHCGTVPGVERDGFFSSRPQCPALPGCCAACDGNPELPAGSLADVSIRMMRW